MALDIGLAISHSTYDTFVAFHRRRCWSLMAASRAFGSAMLSHLDPELAGLLILLEEWGRGRALSQVPDPPASCKLSKEKDNVPDQ